MSKIVWVDVETTGLDHKTDTIIELAALYEDGKTKSVFHVYILPELKPDDFNVIEELTGITWEYLEKNGITEAEAYSKFSDWLGLRIDKYNKKDKAIFAAYNARFDNDFMREFFKHNYDNYFGSWFFSAPLDIMSTAVLCVKLSLIPVPENFKNSTICESFRIEHKLHSAIEDIKASRQAELKMEELLCSTLS